jgi:FkbM family methyltransferase
MKAPSPFHWIRFLASRGYRVAAQRNAELKRLRHAPRYHPLTTRILGPELALVDGRSFYYSYKEIFEDGIYAFKASRRDAVIIDGGANIGLSVIFFKRTYPGCVIHAFEADPVVFQILRTNVVSFGIDDARLTNKALWKAKDNMAFLAEGADGGRLAREADRGGARCVTVETDRLVDYIPDGGIDFLKLDIEGAETDVLLDAADRLHLVENLFVEYHSFAGEEQRLDELLRILRRAKFRVQVRVQAGARQPFLDRPTRLGMDLQLNIFGYRDRKASGAAP